MIKIMANFVVNVDYLFVKFLILSGVTAIMLLIETNRPESV